MLDGMRNHAQSWGVKIAFGIIIVVFVFWGVGSFTSQPSGVATVNGEPVTLADFQAEYSSQIGLIKQAYPQLTDTELEQMGFAKQVLQSLLVKELLVQEADRTGVTISPQELRSEIAGYQMFSDTTGKFSNETYINVLQAQGMTPGYFETMVIKDLLERKFRQNIGIAAYVSDAELIDLNNFQNQRATIDYIFFPSSDYITQVKVEEQEIVDEYNKRSELYKVPAKASIEYIKLDPKHFADPTIVSASEVEQVYNQRKNNEYSLAERVQASHIVLLAAKDISPEEDAKVLAEIQALAQRIKDGENFGELANQYSADSSAIQNGELGWFTRGQMVESFENAAFALEDGQVSEPVRSEFGYHLIKLQAKETARVKSLAEVEEEIRVELAVPLAQPALQEAVDNALIAVIGGKSVQDLANEKKYDLSKTELGDEQAIMRETGMTQADAQAILASSAGAVIQKAIPTSSGFIIASVSEVAPAGVRPLDDVRIELQIWLENIKAKELAAAEAKKVRDSFTDEAKIPPSEYNDKIKRSQAFARDGYIPELGLNVELVRAVFGATKNEWLGSSYNVDAGTVLVKPAEKINPDNSSDPASLEQLKTSLLGAKKEEMYQIFLQKLWSDAKVVVLEPSLK